MNFKIIYIYKEAVCIDVCFKSTEIKDEKKKKKTSLRFYQTITQNSFKHALHYK